MIKYVLQILDLLLTTQGHKSFKSLFFSFTDHRESYFQNTMKRKKSVSSKHKVVIVRFYLRQDKFIAGKYYCGYEYTRLKKS